MVISVCKDNFEGSAHVAGFFSSARCASRSSRSCTPCPVHVLVAMRHSGDAVCPCGPCVNLRVTGAIRWTACFRIWSGSCRARCGMTPGRKWWSCTRSGALSASDATDLRHDDNTFVRHRETARQPCQPRRRPCAKRYRISHPTLRQPHRSRMPQIAAQAMDLTRLNPGNPRGIPRRAPCACADFSGTMRPRNA